MDEYISREALMQGVENVVNNRPRGGAIDLTRKFLAVIDKIKTTPATDVVEVVRCKYCVYGEQYDEEIEDWRECRRDGCGLVYEISHFCSHGKRKDETRRKDREKK